MLYVFMNKSYIFVDTLGITLQLVLTCILIIYLLIMSLQVTMSIRESQETQLCEYTDDSIIIKYLIRFDNFINSIYLKLKVITPIILAILIITLTLLSYASIYKNINKVFVDDDSIGITQINKEELDEYDYFYFSSVTYFTIGYGDIIPVGSIVKTTTITEMIIAFIINISFVPIIITVLLTKDNRNNETSVI